MIQFLNSDCFGGQLRDPIKTGLNPLFRAKIRVGDESLHCYVKPIPDKVWERPGTYEFESSEILSEAIGYVLAGIVGLPVAKNAGVIELDRDQIPERVRRGLDFISPSGPQKSYLAWFSQDTTYPNLVQKHVDGFPDFMKERRAKETRNAALQEQVYPGNFVF